MVIGPTWGDISQNDAHILVAVRAFLLVVEAQSVKDLVLDSVIVDTAGALQGEILSVASTANVGVTPASQ